MQREDSDSLSIKGALQTAPHDRDVLPPRQKNQNGAFFCGLQNVCDNFLYQSDIQLGVSLLQRQGFPARLGTKQGKNRVKKEFLNGVSEARDLKYICFPVR